MDWKPQSKRWSLDNVKSWDLLVLFSQLGLDEEEVSFGLSISLISSIQGKCSISVIFGAICHLYIYKNWTGFTVVFRCIYTEHANWIFCIMNIRECGKILCFCSKLHLAPHYARKAWTLIFGIQWLFGLETKGLGIFMKLWSDGKNINFVLWSWTKTSSFWFTSQ